MFQAVCLPTDLCRFYPQHVGIYTLAVTIQEGRRGGPLYVLGTSAEKGDFPMGEALCVRNTWSMPQALSIGATHLLPRCYPCRHRSSTTGVPFS